MKIAFIKTAQIILSLIIFILLKNCTPIKSKELDYCKMLERDQSYVSFDTTASKERILSANNKREQIFKENFNLIIQHSKINGFPEMGSLKTSGIDSCRNWVVFITLFHIGQSQPELFFEVETRQIIEKEIKEGRLESGALFAPLREGFLNFEFCKNQKDDIYEALDHWGLKATQLPTIKFTDCVK